MKQVTEGLAYLGLRVKDAVTSFEGIVTTVSFDLYGCVIALVHPGLDKDNKLLDSQWFDVNRLKIADSNPIMPVPDYAYVHGPAHKPAFPPMPKPFNRG